MVSGVRNVEVVRISKFYAVSCRGLCAPSYTLETDILRCISKLWEYQLLLIIAAIERDGDTVYSMLVRSRGLLGSVMGFVLRPRSSRNATHLIYGAAWLQALQTKTPRPTTSYYALCKGLRRTGPELVLYYS